MPKEWYAQPGDGEELQFHTEDSENTGEFGVSEDEVELVFLPPNELEALNVAYSLEEYDPEQDQDFADDLL